ncbi:Basement membrane-specific heparan sulfate proteoglycan core protein [Phytophthora pseudosyringae]|uniref:Basement membrane-specific heparan sulfate proteoglycan core protein n=1 Tax=Phytophthora pseudosyringae TaxID=221518 RepID=A0A8T1VHG3_9STRA|nr:Basement membrane-specific heparan sulfate proteoglycan core protein [Phytophthora pseudosyringae]
MVAVSPTPGDIKSAQPQNIGTVLRALRCLRRSAGRLPGEYTVAKLDAFDRFRRETSPLQSAASLLLTPMPCILANFVVESIPLTDPATGFHGCLPFLLRNFVSATIVTMVPFRIKPDCIPQLPIQPWKLALGFGILLGLVSTGTIAALIHVVGSFPVPSSQFSPMIAMGMIGQLIEFRLLHTPQVKPRLEKIDLWLGMVVAPILVYPLFTAVFMALPPRLQLWFSLLLPVLKHLLRYLLWLVARDDLDLVVSVTCTIGHFYHVLFTAMCLQNAKTLETLVAVLAVNFIHMLLNCREIGRDAEQINTAKSKLLEVPESTTTEDVIATALKLAQTDRVARALHRKRPSRYVSQYPKYQGTEFLARHQALLTQQRINTTQTSELSPRAPQILPVSDTRPGSKITTTGDTTRTRSHLAYESQNDGTRKDEYFVRSVTSTLHQTEFILLRSYITIFGLSFYGVYLMLVFWLPNNRYFATMTHMTSFNAVATMVFHVLLLCGVELLFFAAYLVVIRRHLGVSGITQLGFVLYSQRVLIQGKFVMLSIMILGFPLEHYGNGFIFQLHAGS